MNGLKGLLTAIAAALLSAWPLAGWPANLPAAEETFLDAVEHKAFDFFWKQGDPETGLIPDGTHTGDRCSTASVGFGLSAICVADSRKWITHEQAYRRVLATLKTFQSAVGNPDRALAEGKFGLFFHFINKRTGRWEYPMDCVSAADTGLFMGGVITCMEYFKGTEIEHVADQIFRACQWDAFMQDNEGQTQDFIAMGYIPPERPSPQGLQGFFGRYHGYEDNSFMIYILALASPTHTVPVSTWYAAQTTYQWQEHQGQPVIMTTPPGMAFHYYPHCWLDLRFKKDQVTDYFQNSIRAVSAQQEYCGRIAGYPEGLWGISSSMSGSANGYEPFGAPWGAVLDDGTITPHAIIGGLVFTPEKALQAMHTLDRNYRHLIWGEYGFTDACNVRTQWSTPHVLGLDQGPIVLMIENYRTGLIWKTTMRNRYIREAMKKIGFVGIVEDFETLPVSYAYSSFRLAEGKAKLALDSALAMEGKRSLHIQPEAPGRLSLAFEPSLQDYSPYAYLSLWGKNIEKLDVAMATASGKRKLPLVSSIATGTGKKYYFSLEMKPGEQCVAVDEWVLDMTPSEAGQHQGVWLDGVVATYTLADQLPLPPEKLSASFPRGNAVVKITFAQPPHTHRYDVRISPQPIRNQDDFDQVAGSSMITWAWPKSPQKEIYRPLPSAGQYFVAVQSVDAQGLRSQVAVAPPLTASNNRTYEVITDFQEGLSSYRMQWGSGQEIRLSLDGRPGKSGKRTMRVQYSKTDKWQYFELRFSEPLDLSPYRFLQIPVCGREQLIAKLFNTLEQQEDIGNLTAEDSAGWNELRYDLDKIRIADKSKVQKVLFFVAPGQIKSGIIDMGEIRLCSE